jgi:heme exporter protein A
MAQFFGDNLTCFRGGRIVFADLSFSLGDGDALVLRGPNGSGKSSLLRVMAGLIDPVGGGVTWEDDGTTFSIQSDPDDHHRRIHFVGHADAVKPVLSVRENISFWANLRTAAPDIDGALSALGIVDLADVPGRFLSAGQKRRVGLARVLAVPATLWLLDEPATALDAGSIAALEKAIEAHRAGGGMVVASTHQDLHFSNQQILNLDAVTGPEPNDE